MLESHDLRHANGRGPWAPRSACRARRLVSAFFLALAVSSGCGDADPLPRVDPQPREAIEGATQTLLLDFAGTPDAAGPNPVMAARADGSLIAVSALTRPSGILIFDDGGRFLHSVGRQGMGPGELEMVIAMTFDAADSLWVFGRGRVDVFDPEFEFARSMPIRMSARTVAMTLDGRGIFVAGAPDPSEIRARVRLLSSDGDLTPLERESGMYVAGEMGSGYRTVAPSEQGYWVANFHEWDIRHLTLTGDTLARINDTPEWWEPSDAPELEGYIDTAPAILGIHLDGDGRLWVAAGIPIPDRDAFEAFAQGATGAEVATALADHVIRIYDASTTELLSEQRFDYLPLKFLNRDLAAAAIPRGDSVVVAVYRLDERR